MDLLPALLREAPDLAVVVVTAYATIASAVEAMRRGAFDYLPKPFTPDQLRVTLERWRQMRRLRREVADLREQVREAYPETDLETVEPAMRQALDLAFQAAASEATVLLRGESGTGKGVLARAMHSRSPRAGGPFVTVHCPSLSAELLESELFGHVKGAFTGAVTDTTGKAAAADGGTLFLDEIADLPLSVQPKLLRLVQDKAYERVGETRTRVADVRILTATNRDLQAETAAGRFREDLYYRLNVIEVELPPLRLRRGDIPPLAERLLRFFARQSAKPAEGVHAGRPGGAGALRLAGQRPRAAQRRGARRHPGAGPRDRPGAPAGADRVAAAAARRGRRPRDAGRPGGGTHPPRAGGGAVAGRGRRRCSASILARCTASGSGTDCEQYRRAASAP